MGFTPCCPVMRGSLPLALCLLGLLALSANAEQSSSWTWKFPTAEEYLFYSYAAYCPSTSLTTWTCKWCNESMVNDFVPVAFPYAERLMDTDLWDIILSIKLLSFLSVAPLIW